MTREVKLGNVIRRFKTRASGRHLEASRTLARINRIAFGIVAVGEMFRNQFNSFIRSELEKRSIPYPDDFDWAKLLRSKIRSVFAHYERATGIFDFTVEDVEDAMSTIAMQMFFNPAREAGQSVFELWDASRGPVQGFYAHAIENRARNLAEATIRDRQRYLTTQPIHDGDEEGSGTVFDIVPSADDAYGQLEVADISNRIRDQIATHRLASELLPIYDMMVSDGLAPHEIAKQTNTPPGRVNYRVREIREIVRNFYEKEGLAGEVPSFALA